jgi:hypothetical protein
MLAADSGHRAWNSALLTPVGAAIALEKLKVVHAYITFLSYFAQPHPCFATYARLGPGVGNHA